jgi:hypothetical protein
MSRRLPAAMSVGLLACLALAACDNPRSPFEFGSRGIGGGLGNADPATRVACTERAEQIYNQRNRADIYTPQSSINAPFSGSYQPGTTDHGLSDRYAQDAMIRDCVRNTGTETGRVLPSAPEPGPAVRR